MTLRIGLLALVLAFGATARADDDGESRGKVLASTRVSLSGGAELRFSVRQLNPDPIYLIFASLKGETSSSPGDTVRVIASGPGTGALGVGAMVAASVLLGQTNVTYAQSVMQQNVNITTGNISVEFNPAFFPGDNGASLNFTQLQSGVTGIALSIAGAVGGPDAIAAANQVLGALGLTGPSSSSGAGCGALKITYEAKPPTSSRVCLGQVLSVTVRQSTAPAGQSTLPPVSGALVQACAGGATLPARTTDSDGAASWCLPAGTLFTGVTVTATLSETQISCSNGASCGSVDFAK